MPRTCSAALLGLIIAAYPLSSVAAAASKLPQCPTDQSVPFNNCYGTWSNGQFTYTGEWKDDKQDGWGQSVFITGDSYIGEFKAGKRNGHGTFVTSSGEKFVGEFVDDALNGKGTQYDAAGNVVDSGLFANNVLIRSDIPKAAATEQSKTDGRRAPPSVSAADANSDSGAGMGAPTANQAASGNDNAPLDSGSCAEDQTRSEAENKVLRATGFLLGGDTGWAGINGTDCRVINGCTVEYRGALSKDQVSGESNPLAQQMFGGQLKFGTMKVALDWNKAFWKSTEVYGRNNVAEELRISCSGNCMVKSDLKDSVFTGGQEEGNALMGMFLNSSPQDAIILPLVADVDRMQAALRDIQSVCEGQESAY